MYKLEDKEGLKPGLIEVPLTQVKVTLSNQEQRSP